MTFTLAIDINCKALVRLVAMLFEASGLVPGKPAMLSRIIRGSVLHRLRPAESAARRLVMMIAQDMKARGLSFKPRAKRAAPTKPIPRGGGTRASAFALFDPRKRFGTEGRRRFAKGAGPRLSFFDGADPAREPVAEKKAVALDAPMDATRLCRRMEALQRALEDLPKQAKRLLRLQARKPSPRSPMRPGRPPGFRARGRCEVDEILRECHQLALWAMAAPDTS